MAGQREEYKGEERNSWNMESEDSWRQDLVEVKGLSSGWLFCFSDLQVEPQYLSLGFYYSSYIEQRERAHQRK